MAIVANCGVLHAPTSKKQYLARSVPLPPQLFSHVDQQFLWMTSSGGTSGAAGWGGRIAEAVAEFNAGGAIATCLSLAGNNPFQISGSATPYTIDVDGPVALVGFEGEEGARRWRSFEAMLARPRDHMLERAQADVLRRSIECQDRVSRALLQAPATAVRFPSGSLGRQLEAVLRMIAVHERLEMSRQIFFVSINGFDTHDQQALAQPVLLRTVSRALGAFDEALAELGLAAKVCTFTASEFGRTLTTNGRGTDHGWAGHQLVLGGAVRGGEVYGRLEEFVLDGPDDVGHGRVLPSTAVDQVGATLARWFGVPASELDTLFPGLARFERADLGFLG